MVNVGAIDAAAEVRLRNRPTATDEVYCRVCVPSVSEFFFKSVNIWQSYKQERRCLMHYARLANTLLKDEESARNNNVIACSLTSPNIHRFLKFFTLSDSSINLC